MKATFLSARMHWFQDYVSWKKSFAQGVHQHNELG